MQYQIRYSYTIELYEIQVTLENSIPLFWNDLKIAKENVSRILEHLEFFKKWLETPSLNEKMLFETVQEKDWYCIEDPELIKLKLNSGKFQNINAVWVDNSLDTPTINFIEIISIYRPELQYNL